MSVGYDKTRPERLSAPQEACLAKFTDSFALYPGERRIIEIDDPLDTACHGKTVAPVERMLDLHRQLAEAKLPQARTVLQRQIDATGRPAVG